MTNQNFNTILAEALAREKNVPTNADCIRSMTDEELAVQLVSEQIIACVALLKGLDDKDLLFAYLEKAKAMKSEMIKEKLDWLKKEVEK